LADLRTIDARTVELLHRVSDSPLDFSCPCPLTCRPFTIPLTARDIERRAIGRGSGAVLHLLPERWN
jgi:hypothetical protein